MSEEQKQQAKFYLTTPIYYVNARPHIGHAYTTIVADVIARRHRLLGDDTWFLTGTDEHGQKIERAASAAGVPPQQYADKVSASFRDLWARMGITYNRDGGYIRTTEPRHIKGVQKLFSDLFEQGFIYLDSYTGAYCVSDEMFVDVKPGEPCPDCGRITETVTEENFFFKLSSFQRPLLDLIESDTLKIENESRRNEVLSFLLGPVGKFKEEGFIYVPSMSASARDLDKSKNISEFVKVDQLSYTAKGTPYVPGALNNLSVSRSSFTWGVPVPNDILTKLNSKQEHVIYVWLDALANYMTAIGYGSDDPKEQKKFKHYWPANLHLVGKEIIRFHCVYWPAFLLALNPQLKLPTATQEQDKHLFVRLSDLTDVSLKTHQTWAEEWLPKTITAHGWLLFEDSKMSKSRGNIVRTETILDAFGTLKPKPEDLPGPVLSDEAWKHEQDLFASDVLRYFLLREIPFGQDGSFSFDALVQRYNSDLANGYGNLVSRTLGLIVQNFSSGEVVGSPTGTARIPPLTIDNDTLAVIYSNSLHAHADTLSGLDLTENEWAFQIKLQRIFDFIQKVDVFINEEKPWKLAAYLRSSTATIYPDGASQKQFEAELREVTIRLECILYTAAESIRIITALLYPILPYATAAVWAQLGLGDIEESARKGELKGLEWGGLKPGTKLGPLSPIFPRAPKELIQTMMDKEASLLNVTVHHNASTSTHTEFAEAPLASKFVDEKTTHTAPIPDDPTHPAAPPRTSALAEQNPGTHVAASAALTTERTGTPSHTEAQPSGVFAQSSQPTAQSPAPTASETTPQIAPQIAIDDFIKIDLRVAQIVVAERIPKADKLLRLEVDLGNERRQILSGIAEWYTPEELIGRRIVVIANLAPRKMRGLESHGMLLAASHGEAGKPILATFAEDIALGSRLK